MPAFSNAPWFPVCAALLLSIVLTPVVRALARRCGAVARPKSDRWHKRPTAMLGGLAIAATVLIVVLTTIDCSPQIIVVLATSSFLFVLGLVDDFWHLKPYQKLIGQVIGAAVVVSFGITLPWTGSVLVNMAITIFWIVGVTNAVNLLDNMDGLAAGIAVIAASFLAVNAVLVGEPTGALVLAVFAAALVGFLVYNSNPASIFMGDCGSMFIGFFLASATLISSTMGRSRSILPVLAVPVLTLFIPIFDTTFVMVLRTLAGRSPSRGGRDHTSHRLVALGLSERRAVWMLYGFAILAGLLGLLVQRLTLDVGLAIILVFTAGLTVLGVHLAGVKVYDESEIQAARETPLVSFLVDVSYKRRVVEVLLDVILIVFSYYMAHVLFYGPIVRPEHRLLFVRVVPVLVVIKLGSFLALGVYRGFWRYITLDTLALYARAVVLGSVLSVLTLVFAFRFQGFSRAIMVLDGLTLLVLLTGSRLVFRVIRRHLPAAAAGSGRRVLIFGAGDGGELLLREVANNPRLDYALVGFADDDPHKKGKMIHGFRVLGGNGSFLSICEAQKVEEVLISTTKIPAARMAEILNVCERANVVVKRMNVTFESLIPE
jgi:UDP-GlcNAc:undecaprenyl-phosphate GlcNAc-1-phosphate transferase